MACLMTDFAIRRCLHGRWCDCCLMLGWNCLL